MARKFRSFGLGPDNPFFPKEEIMQYHNHGICSLSYGLEVSLISAFMKPLYTWYKIKFSYFRLSNIIGDVSFFPVELFPCYNTKV